MAPVGPRMLASVAAALAGTVPLVGGVARAAFDASPRAWLAGFGSAVAFAFYIVHSKRGLARCQRRV